MSGDPFRKSLLILAREGKIIRREDAACYDEAKRVLQIARREGVRLLQAARREIEHERLRGYEEGLRDGRRHQARLLAEAILRRDAFFVQAEQEVCNLVIAGVRKIFSEFSDAEKTRIVVRKAISALRFQSQIVIRVNPSQYEAVWNDIAHIKALMPHLRMLTVEPDGTVPQTACVVSSELGTVQADIDTQIEALELALAKTMTGENGVRNGNQTDSESFIIGCDADKELLGHLLGEPCEEVSDVIVAGLQPTV